MIENNVAAREAAELVANLMEEQGRIYGPRFWEGLGELIGGRLQVKVDAEVKKKARAMTDAAARRFGHQLMPYGEFAGRRVDDVSLDRLRWYADQVFTDDLRRYLESDRVGREDADA